MLIIGDVHASAKLVQPLIKTIDAYVRSHDPQDVVCMGDIVYQFSYNRDVVVRFFRMLVGWCDAGYRVHVLAGNHDWIANHYIYEELASIETVMLPRFYTQPTVVVVEGIRTLMLPHNMHLQQPPHTGDAETATTIDDGIDQLNQTIESWLQRFVETYDDDQLCVMHHYYVAQTQFPGVTGAFGYRDPAIAPHWLDHERLLLIAGHIHHGFWYKNFLCTGAIRDVLHRDPNRIPCLHQRDWTAKSLVLTPCFGAGWRASLPQPHQRSSSDDKDCHAGQTDQISQATIDAHLQQCYETTLHHYREQALAGRDVQLRTDVMLATSDIHLDIIADDATYEELDSYVAPDLQTALHSIRLTKQLDAGQAVDRLETDHRDLTSSISDRKSLLTDYIAQKYPGETERYLSILKKQKIL